METEALARKIFEVSHITGEFKLRSGLTSHEYFDKYRFESQPKLLKEIAKHLKSMIPKGIDAFAALEMGGIPIATALSLETGIPVAFIRKKAKDYGTCQFAEGIDIKGKNLLIIEDVISTGGQVALSTQDLRNSGATVEHVMCVIFRNEKNAEKLDEMGLKYQYLFSKEDLNKHAK